MDANSTSIWNKGWRFRTMSSCKEAGNSSPACCINLNSDWSHTMGRSTELCRVMLTTCTREHRLMVQTFHSIKVPRTAYRFMRCNTVVFANVT